MTHPFVVRNPREYVFVYSRQRNGRKPVVDTNGGGCGEDEGKSGEKRRGDLEGCGCGEGMVQEASTFAAGWLEYVFKAVYVLGFKKCVRVDYMLLRRENNFLEVSLISWGR